LNLPYLAHIRSSCFEVHFYSFNFQLMARILWLRCRCSPLFIAINGGFSVLFNTRFLMLDKWFVLPEPMLAVKAGAEAFGSMDRVAVQLCRSGKRSALAAEAACKAGPGAIVNVLEGFEGARAEQQQRGKNDGWRFRGLPWLQD
jgi:hypothetical protein